MEKHLSVKDETKGYINNIIKSSIVDGPGNRIAIFMQGCNFNCWYCHNPETIKKSEHTKTYYPIDLYNELKPYFSFVDGITISGGEALLQQDFIIEFFKLIKQHSKLNCLIDTNGSVDIKSELLELTDGFMLDVKVVDVDEHLKLTNERNDKVLSNLKMLDKLEKLVEVRTVLYPGYNHQETIDYVKNILSSNVNYKLIKYHSKGVREHLIPKE